MFLLSAYTPVDPAAFLTNIVVAGLYDEVLPTSAVTNGGTMAVGTC
jgi:hypothetical protein